MAETPQEITVQTGFVTDSNGETTERVAQIPTGNHVRVGFEVDPRGGTTQQIARPGE